jgi:putative Ca2+/H+ antiporter (TMEM165/GDT1 family)
MPWKTTLTTFILVFLAELGDKTQLTTMFLSAQNKSPIGVFIGASSALVLSATLGVIAGSTLMKYIPPHFLKIGTGTAFIVIGLILLTSKH